MSQLILATIGGHIINVGDISTVAPHTEPQAPEGQREGVKVTFMSKATYFFVPGLTAEEFMDRLVTNSVRLSDRD